MALERPCVAMGREAAPGFVPQQKLRGRFAAIATQGRSYRGAQGAEIMKFSIAT